MKRLQPNNIKHNPIEGIIKVSPFDQGVSAKKASKISRLLGYKSGTIHLTKLRKYHPCINHEDFVEKYFNYMKEKMPVFNENGNAVVIF